MSGDPFWLDDGQWSHLAPLLPTDVRGVARADDRRVISGIVHVLRTGCRWSDAPECYGPRKTLYSRFVRWARRGVWDDVFEGLAEAGGPPAALMLDATHAKAHRSAAGGRRGAAAQAIGRSRGGRTTKLHMAVDEAERPRLDRHAGPTRRCARSPGPAVRLRARHRVGRRRLRQRRHPRHHRLVERRGRHSQQPAETMPASLRPIPLPRTKHRRANLRKPQGLATAGYPL